MKTKTTILPSHPYYVKPKCVVQPSRKVKYSDAICVPPKGCYAIILNIYLHDHLRYGITLLRYRNFLYSTKKDWDHTKCYMEPKAPNAKKVNGFVKEIIKQSYQIILDNDMTSHNYDHNLFLEKLDARMGYEPQPEHERLQVCSICEYCNENSLDFRRQIRDWRGNTMPFRYIKICKKQGISPEKLKRLIQKSKPFPFPGEKRLK